MEKYIVETSDTDEANLLVNVKKLAGALYDLKTWRDDLYNSKTTEAEYIYEGNIYTQSDILNMEIDKNKNLHEIVEVKKIIEKLDIIMEDVRYLIEEYYI